MNGMPFKKNAPRPNVKTGFSANNRAMRNLVPRSQCSKGLVRATAGTHGGENNVCSVALFW